MLISEFCEISKNTFLKEHLQTTATGLSIKNYYKSNMKHFERWIKFGILKAAMLA